MTENKKQMPPELKEKLKAGFNLEWRKELRKSIPVKERMKLSRKKMPERNPDERNKDFSEVNMGLDLKKAQEEAHRCMDCANPQCVLGCPVGIDIPSFIKLIEIGDFVKSKPFVSSFLIRVIPNDIKYRIDHTLQSPNLVMVVDSRKQ